MTLKAYSFDPLVAALKGVAHLERLVSTTLGPRGRNVILHAKGRAPITTKDGVTVAKFVDLEDPFENAAAQIVKQAAEQTNADSGDGTTTSTVLAYAILKQAMRYMAADVSPVELKRGIDKAVEVIEDKIRGQAVEVRSKDDLERIATISSNGDESIGKLVAQAVDAIGKDGAIVVQDSTTPDTHLDLIEGFRIDSGYISKSFINDERTQMVKYEEPYVLVTDHAIKDVEQIMPVLEIAGRSKRPVVIVGDVEVSSKALASLIINAHRLRESVPGTIKAVAVSPPRFGMERHNILSDLALSIGATFISRESGKLLQKVTIDQLGKCASIEIQKNLTTFIGGKGSHDKVDLRIKSLQEEIKQTENLAECKIIQERITRLSAGIAMIYLGAPTDVELVEKRHRLDDALEAVRAAQAEGLVAGGGVTLLYAAADLKVPYADTPEQKIGVEIVRQACEAPIRKIILNAGKSADVIVAHLRNHIGSKPPSGRKHGYNAANNEYGNMFDFGIIDPAKVTRCALRNAASAAGAILISSAVIVEE